MIWDNESGIGRGKRHAEGVAAFAGVLATTVQRLKPYDPESKGVVESPQRVLRDLVRARPVVCVTGRLQLPVH